jgi:UDP-N-acetylglucosamine:LPS N-acetylglucosamine transferase
VIGVFTGSLGSQRVNDAVVGLVERWAHRADLAVRHVTGARDHERVVAARPSLPEDGIEYQQVVYEGRMDLLLAAADLAVTRAGAGTCSELAAFGTPAVMVPLPIATRDHQTANAGALVEAGGAVLVPDDELDAGRLERELAALLDDPGHLERMRAGMRSLARLDAAERVADVVEAKARG